MFEIADYDANALMVDVCWWHGRADKSCKHNAKAWFVDQFCIMSIGPALYMYT